MKQMIALLGLIAVTLFTQASPLPEYPFVFARGEAKTKLPPDIARVSYRIKAFDKISTNVLALMESCSLKTISILSTNGVKKEDVVGFEVEKDILRNYDKQSEKELEIIGYDMSRRIEFTLRDLSKYEAIVSALLKMPNVSNIRTEFDRTDRDIVEEDLLADAVSDARRKAEVMAKGSHQRIKGLKAISQQGFNNLGEAFGFGSSKYENLMYSTSGAQEKDLLFIPSTVEFQSSVVIVYEVAEAK
jgi:uncharacterized protein YggE